MKESDKQSIGCPVSCKKVDQTLRTIFLSDNRTSYLQGTYYETYSKGAEETLGALVIELGASPIEFSLADRVSAMIRNAEAIFVGHGALDYFLQPRRPWWSSLLDRPRARIVSALRSAEGTKIVFSKNDYKGLASKNYFFENIRPSLVVTHTRQAEVQLTSHNWRTRWFPFATDPRIRMYRHGSQRTIDVGFRSNRNSAWNDGKRDEMYKALKKLDGTFRLDISISNGGETFLLGSDYFRWLDSCHLLANTESALGTVGPQFAESFALSVVPLAPRGIYEGLLLADQHYLSVETNFSDMGQKIKIFLNSSDLKEELQGFGEIYFRDHLVGSQLKTILEEAIHAKK